MSRTKHCEICGSVAPNGFYRFLSMATNLIFLNSPFIEWFDRDSWTVHFRGGGQIPIAFDFGDYALTTDNMIPHFFCSEACEDKYLNSFVTRFSMSLGASMPGIRLDPDESPMGVSTDPYTRYHRDDICDQCGDVFPNDDKSFSIAKIISTADEPHRLHSPLPDLEGTKYSMAQTDTATSNPSGRVIKFELDLDQRSIDHFKMFCSNDCCFDYASSHNCTIQFISNIARGQRVVITPFTKDVNRELTNKNPYHPTTLGR